MAVRPLCSPILDGGKHCGLQTLQRDPAVRLQLEEVFDSTGVPPGTLNVVLGSSEVASYLIEASTAAISFTGSIPAGQDVAEQASSRLKKVVLELGGSDPFIVLDDADVEAASTGAVAGRFINNGQSCICAKRFFVAKKIADEFLDRFTSKTKF